MSRASRPGAGPVVLPSVTGRDQAFELLATDLGTGTVDAGEISLAAGAAGAAGSDVAGVVYHSRTRGDVTATVNEGCAVDSAVVSGTPGRSRPAFRRPSS